MVSGVGGGKAPGVITKTHSSKATHSSGGFAYRPSHPPRKGFGRGKFSHGRSAEGRQGSGRGETHPESRAEWYFLTTSGEISGVEVRMHAGEPHANVEHLHQLPKASHEDSDNACVRVPANDGCEAVIVIQVNPAARPIQKSIMVIEEKDKG